MDSLFLICCCVSNFLQYFSPTSPDLACAQSSNPSPPTDFFTESFVPWPKEPRVQLCPLAYGAEGVLEGAGKVKIWFSVSSLCPAISTIFKPSLRSFDVRTPCKPSTSCGPKHDTPAACLACGHLPSFAHFFWCPPSPCACESCPYGPSNDQHHESIHSRQLPFHVQRCRMAAISVHLCSVAPVLVCV